MALDVLAAIAADIIFLHLANTDDNLVAGFLEFVHELVSFVLIEWVDVGCQLVFLGPIGWIEGG